VSSSGPPGACTTPSRLMNSVITMPMSLHSCSSVGYAVETAVPVRNHRVQRRPARE
jgi:hypothetical protein